MSVRSIPSRSGVPAPASNGANASSVHGARRVLQRARAALSRVGWLAFVLFLLKGALWLCVPYVLAVVGMSS
jgi:hypothetical protein